jgi:hypothetical protein
MIDQSIVDKALNALNGVSLDQWQSAKAEIQDDGKYLLLLVDAPNLKSEELTTERRAQIAERLNIVIPNLAADNFGSWMVVFKKSGEVFASVYPGPGGL